MLAKSNDQESRLRVIGARANTIVKFIDFAIFDNIDSTISKSIVLKHIQAYLFKHLGHSIFLVDIRITTLHDIGSSPVY